ncbi:MAG: multiubiquitin domain-containing protein [Candidatus Acidiferrales bacterium]
MAEENERNEGDADKGYEITVNGTHEIVPSETVAYDQVTKLAYPTPPAPNTTYTVTYRNAEDNKSGSLVEGGSIEVKRRSTIFNVDPTTKS